MRRSLIVLGALIACGTVVWIAAASTQSTTSSMPPANPTAGYREYDSEAGYTLRHPPEWTIEGTANAVTVRAPKPSHDLTIEIIGFSAGFSELPRPRAISVLSSVRSDGRRVDTWERKREGSLRRVSVLEWSSQCPERCAVVPGVAGEMTLRIAVSGSSDSWTREAETVSLIVRSLAPSAVIEDRADDEFTVVVMEVKREDDEQPIPDAVVHIPELGIDATSDLDGIAVLDAPLDHDCMLATVEVRAAGFGRWRLLDHPIYQTTSYGDAKLTARSYEERIGPPLADLYSCGRPEAKHAEIGIPYVHVLRTHCGVLDAYFDGRAWVANPPLTDEGGGNPPPGWADDENATWGTMTLISKNRAEFHGRRGQVAHFKPRPRNAPDDGECN